MEKASKMCAKCGSFEHPTMECSSLLSGNGPQPPERAFVEDALRMAREAIYRYRRHLDAKAEPVSKLKAARNR